MNQDTLSIRHETDNANLSCKEGFGSPNLTPAGSIQNILKKTGLMQPNLSPVGSIQAEWVDDKPKQQAAVEAPTSESDAVPLDQACDSLQMRESLEMRRPAESAPPVAADQSQLRVHPPNNPDAETGDDKVKAQASEDPCEYIEGHGAGPFKGQDQVDTEVSEKRQALLKMKVALGNDVTDPTKAQVVAPYDFGYTPSQGDHRNAEQKAADAKHAKEQRKAEEALRAKQHEYEKQQEESAEEQAVQDGEAIAKRLQSAHLGPTPSTAGHGKHKAA